MAIAVSQAYKDAIRGPIDRSKLKVEVYFSGALGWVDISDRVEQASGEKEEGSDKGTASTNTAILTLINDDGRFSSKNSAGPYYGNLTPNKPMRASIVVGSESCRLGTVYSGAWPTQAKARTCQVQFQDAARILLRKDLEEETVFNPSNLAAGYYLTRVLERAAWLSGLRWDAVTTKTDLNGHAWAFTSHDGNAVAVTKNAGAAVATYTLGGQLVMQLDLVDLLIPVAPLKGKALAVLDQLAKVVDGRIYFEAQGQLVFRARMYRNDSTAPSVETFTVDNLDDVITDQGFEGTRFAPLINRAEVTSTPYTFRLDADGQVLEEEIPFKGDLFAKYHFAPGESYPASGDADLWCELPNGVQIAKAGNYPAADNVILESAPKSDLTKRGTGIRFKSGFPVFEQGRMKVAFENAGTEAEVIKTLTLKARMMRPVQRCRGVTKNQASIDLYDQRDSTYNNDLIPHATACKNLSAWKVEDGREPKLVVTLKGMHGVPWLEINDRITVSETLTKSIPVAEDFIVKRIKWLVTLAAFTATIDACSPSPNFTAGALPPSVAIVETSNQNMNGAEQGSLPPQVIDGTQALVGLNNIPAFNSVLQPSILTPPASGQKYLCVRHDGRYIIAALSRGTIDAIVKIDPFTLQTVATYDTPATFTTFSGDGGLVPSESYPISTALVIHEGFVYFQNRDAFDGHIYKMNLSNGATTLVVSEFGFFQDLSIDGMQSAVIYDNTLFVSYTYRGAGGVKYNGLGRYNLGTASKHLYNLGSKGQLVADQDYVYIAGDSIDRISRTDLSIVEGVDRGYNPDGFEFSGGVLFIGKSEVSGEKLIVADRSDGRELGSIPLSYKARRTLFDGKYLWVAQRDSQNTGASAALEVFDAVTRQKISSWPVGAYGIPEMCFTGLHVWHVDGQDIRRYPRFTYGGL